MITTGDRVLVVDRGDQHFGEHGTVTLGEHPAVLTGRAMVEVRIDGQPERFEHGYYTEQIEALLPLRVAS